MALTITVNDANADGSGIDVAAYLADYDATYASAGFGYFSSNATDFSGNQYASTEQANLIPDPTKQSVVFESGGGGKSIDYTFATHTVGGDLDAIAFGYGLTYDSGTDTFPLTQRDLRISGFGFVDQFSSGNIVSALIQDAMAGNITNINNLLAANALIFVGSTGADAFTGFSHDDTFTGGTGSDTLGGGGGSDTFVWGDGDGTDTITDFQPNVDKIDLTGASGISRFSDLFLMDQGNDVFVVLGGGAGFLLKNVLEPGALDADDFIFAGGGEEPSNTSLNNDIDGDGRSDIVFRNPTTGQQSLWEMNGAVTEAATKFGGSVDAAWHLTDLADFDGDGGGELLWRHDNGTVAIWSMNGPVIEAKTNVAKNFDTAWHIDGTGDFNGDGNADLLWRHDDGSVSVWEMDGASVLAKLSVVKKFDLNWHIVGADDFDGDGKDDLLWRNDDTGKSSLWRMDGANVLSKSNVAGSPGLDWHLVDTGDFNGDGHADLLWRQDGGKISIWSMDGATALSKNTVANLSTVWENADVGDYNGDGNDDMLFRNQNTGAVSVWEMDGATVLDKLSAGKVAIDWHVIGDSFDLV